jgi:hypothetical protein
MAQDLFVKAQFTYFQNEEVTCWPSSNKLELRMQMVCQVGSAVVFQKNKKRNSKWPRSICGVLGLLSFKSDQTRSATIKKVLI